MFIADDYDYYGDSDDDHNDRSVPVVYVLLKKAKPKVSASTHRNKHNDYSLTKTINFMGKF